MGNVFYDGVMSYISWSSVMHGVMFYTVDYVLYQEKSLYDGVTFIYTDIVPLA